MDAMDEMDPMERYYEISIGDHSAGTGGPWWRSVHPDHLDVAKTQVRGEVAALLAQIKAPYTLDLDSVLIANGIDPHGDDHIAIPDDVHRRVMQGWLRYVNAQIEDKQDQLWLPEVYGLESSVQVRCCAGTGDKWHACLAMQLYKGPSPEEAQPWSVSVSGETIEQDDGVEVPILIAGSWRCARMEAMSAEMLMEGAGGTMKPFRDGSSVATTRSRRNGETRARNKKGKAAPAKATKNKTTKAKKKAGPR